MDDRMGTSSERGRLRQVDTPFPSNPMAEYPEAPARRWESVKSPVTIPPAVAGGAGLSDVLWRGFEIVLAASLLLLTLPITAALALLIKLTSPGPALFFQVRVGKRGKTFRFVKFRTMYVDARQRFPELYDYTYDEQTIKGLKFKLDPDPRLTAQGSWLRKTSLDELPNFWNVLRGEMALVGPRPEIPEMLPYYKGHMLAKFHVKPGVTGLAQVSGRGYLSFLDTVALDVEYVARRSVAFDLWILVRTVKKVLTRNGAF
jgi:lipopolysaccharide/colanic/teichoic acid biosynthesis glycosyltransferase